MKTGHEVLYLTQKNVEAIGISMKEMINILEGAFTEKGKGNYQMPPKIAIHTQPNDFLHAMPCWIPGADAAGLKWVGGYVNNREQGLPYITGLLILNCSKTGVPLAIMDCVWITAKRTGAVSGLTAKHLARKDSRVIGVIACGVQGRTNLEAMAAVNDHIEKVYAFDFYSERANAYAKEMSEQLGLEVVAVGTPKEAAEHADILITAGPVVLDKDISVVEKEWLKEGVTIITVDADVQFKQSAVQSADKFYTDDIGQFRKFRNDGCVQRITADPAEIGDLLTGKAAGRTSQDETIFACNIGLALSDMAVAKVIYEKAIEQGIGQILPL